MRLNLKYFKCKQLCKAKKLTVLLWWPTWRAPAKRWPTSFSNLLITKLFFLKNRKAVKTGQNWKSVAFLWWMAINNKDQQLLPLLNFGDDKSTSKVCVCDCDHMIWWLVLLPHAFAGCTNEYTVLIYFWYLTCKSVGKMKGKNKEKKDKRWNLNRFWSCLGSCDISSAAWLWQTVAQNSD